jgi:hypothetical protein
LTEKVFLPSMYKPWTRGQDRHITFLVKPGPIIGEYKDTLYIFDTWGTSSYYHLLIDHIIPVHATKQIIESRYPDRDFGNIHFLRISKNAYSTELTTAQDIFRHCLKTNFVESISGHFKYIVYGYGFSYRPYYGPYIPFQYYPNYQTILDRFVVETSNPVSTSESYILVLKRTTRTWEHMESVSNLLSSKFPIRYIDFADYTFEQQIELCSGAYAMIGVEGAAFSNQVFIPKNSRLIILYFEHLRDSLNFHSTLAKYMNHQLSKIPINAKSSVECIYEQINTILSST